MPLRDNFVMDRFAPVADPNVADGNARRKRFQHVGDSILKRSALLLAEDRMLFELAAKNGATHRALGQMLSRPAGTITRRLHRVLARLQNPIVIALCESTFPLPHEYRQLGIEHFLQGQSPHQLAELHQMRLADVNRMLEHVRGWHHGLSMRLKTR